MFKKEKVQLIFSILKSESNAQYNFEDSKDLFLEFLDLCCVFS